MQDLSQRNKQQRRIRFKTMALVKQQLMVQTAELITNAMPAIMAFIDLLKILIDIIGYIGRDWKILGPTGQKFYLLLLRCGVAKTDRHNSSDRRCKNFKSSNNWAGNCNRCTDNSGRAVAYWLMAIAAIVCF